MSKPPPSICIAQLIRYIFSWSVLIFMCVIIVIQSKQQQYKVLFVIFGSLNYQSEGEKGCVGGWGCVGLSLNSEVR